MPSPGTLFVVATPLGNLEDVTLRALEVLGDVALIACEDTRHTRRLLVRHGIRVRCVSYHKFNERQAVPRILSVLLKGKDVALVSDGGTPAISDPGYLLVTEAIEADIPVQPIPGPNAAVAALSASGLPASEFTFRGFLPHRAAERRRVLASISGESPTQVFYESPFRVAETLADMAEVLGPRRCCVAREMTKKFEQWFRGSLPEVAETVSETRPRGEYCIILEGASAAALTAAMDAEHAALPEPGSAAVLAERYRALLAGGVERRAAIKRLARDTGLARSEVYRRIAEARAAGRTPVPVPPDPDDEGPGAGGFVPAASPASPARGARPEPVPEPDEPDDAPDAPDPDDDGGKAAS